MACSPAKRSWPSSAGYSHSLALCSDGTLAAWGYNADGELGNGSTTLSKVPVAVVQSGVLAGKKVGSVVAGAYHTLALCSDGTMAAWGFNSFGQLGDNGAEPYSPSPVAVSQGGALTGKTVIGVSAGFGHSVALCSDGTVAAWGWNAYGQLGNGTVTQQSSVPVATVQNGVLAGKTVTAISAGYGHSLARCSDATLAMWGYNADGELGHGTVTQQSSVPVAVSTSTLASGERFALASSGPAASHTLALVLSPPQPSATTLAATAIGTTGATLNGTVNPSNNSTAASFDYGTDTAYGANVPGTPTPLTGSSATAVSAVLTGLTPGTTYHFRVNGANAAGTGHGNDVTFQTISTNADLSNLVLSSAPLSSAFSSGTMNYTATMTSDSLTTVTATTADPAATVQVNGTTVASGNSTGPFPEYRPQQHHDRRHRGGRHDDADLHGVGECHRRAAGFLDLQCLERCTRNQRRI